MARAGWLKNWSKDHDRDARTAILRIDLATTNDPDNAPAILLTEWTALTILLNATGIPDPRWYSAMARFAKLKVAELRRVLDAIDMRMRAYAGFDFAGRCVTEPAA